MTTYAIISNRECWLGNSFGEDFARRIFGDAVVDALPRFVRGKNKGRLKGVIAWRKVEAGGWALIEHTSRGYVENRVGKVISARLFVKGWDVPDLTIATYTIEDGVTVWSPQEATQ